jgi:hypothetical protein
MLTTSIFEHGDSPFQHEKRNNAVYFSYPYQVIDSITLQVPKELTIEAVPDKKHEENNFAYFDSTWAGKDSTVQMKRAIAVLGIFYPQKEYGSIRDFYSKVASSDQEAVVLHVKPVSQ